MGTLYLKFINNIRYEILDCLCFLCCCSKRSCFIPPQPQPNIIGGWTPDFLKKPIQKPVIIGGWTLDFLKKPVMPKPVIVGGWTPAPKCVPHVKIVPRVCVP